MKSLHTLSIHGAERRTKAYDAVTMPIVASSTYGFASTAELKAYFDGNLAREEYGRYGNPTVRAAEEKVAALEGAQDSLLFPSGMCAITTALLVLLKQGDHVVMTADSYRRTRQFVTTVLSRFGITSTLVKPGDEEALHDALRTPQTRLLISESPTNPYLRLVDLPRLAAVKQRHPGLKLIIDSTFATPINQRPLELGADLVLQSATKYLCGHNDMMAGALSGSASLISLVRDFRGVLGGVLDPHSAFLLIRGIKTLALRVERQNQTALEVARFLESHPEVERVFYPMLESHPDHALAHTQLRGGGGVISFRVRGDLDRGSRFVDACQLATLAPSLGGVETLVEQPALMSYYELTTEERLAIGIPENLIRLSVGLEDPKDIVRDLDQALEVSRPKSTARGDTGTILVHSA